MIHGFVCLAGFLFACMVVVVALAGLAQWLLGPIDGPDDLHDPYL